MLEELDVAAVISEASVLPIVVQQNMRLESPQLATGLLRERPMNTLGP